MSTETMEKPDEMEMGTKPVKEHEWLQNLVGNWKVETEMSMPDGSQTTGTGTENVKSLGGLWAFGEGTGSMPGGDTFEMYNTLGWDVSLKEYRGCWFASMSSHLWKYVGELSEDQKTMTLRCTGPNMFKDGETAEYKDVIELQDKDHRTLTSYGQDENGEWQQFMKASYTRV